MMTTIIIKSFFIHFVSDFSIHLPMKKFAMTQKMRMHT